MRNVNAWLPDREEIFPCAWQSYLSQSGEPGSLETPGRPVYIAELRARALKQTHILFNLGGARASEGVQEGLWVLPEKGRAGMIEFNPEAQVKL